MIGLIIFFVLIAASVITVWFQNNRLRDKIYSLEGDLRDWKASAATLDAECKRWEEAARGKPIHRPELMVQRTSEATTNRWGRMDPE